MVDVSGDAIFRRHDVKMGGWQQADYGQLLPLDTAGARVYASSIPGESFD